MQTILFILLFFTGALEREGGREEGDRRERERERV